MSRITLFSTCPLTVLKFPLSFYFPQNTAFLTSLCNALKIPHIFKNHQQLIFSTSPYNVLKICCFPKFSSLLLIYLPTSTLKTHLPHTRVFLLHTPSSKTPFAIMELSFEGIKQTFLSDCKMEKLNIGANSFLQSVEGYSNMEL